MVIGQAIQSIADKLSRIIARPAIRRLTAGALMACVIFAVIGGKPTMARYAAIVVDADNGRVLYGRNMDHRLYPASLTKIMTLYLTFEALDTGRITMNQPLKVSRRAAGQTPTKLGLRRGRTITVEDAILAIVTRSANDVATVLAEAIGGTEVQFARMMTERARQLGMIRTTFRNATGLPNRRQLSSARDMAKLALAMIRKYPGYYRYFSTRTFTWGKRTHRNTNHLLVSYSGADGIKTGYIRASGFNLVASAERGGRRLIGVVFGGRTALSRDQHMVKLLQAGFAQIAVSDTRGARPVARPGSRPVARPVARPWAPLLVPPAPVPRPWQHATTQPLPKPKPWRNAAGHPPGQAKPTRTAAQKTAWSVQVGVFRDLASAQLAAYRAAAASRILAKRRIRFIRWARDDGVVYRARLTGLRESEARKACQTLRSRQMPCAVVLPNGDITIELARQ